MKQQGFYRQSLKRLWLKDSQGLIKAQELGPRIGQGFELSKARRLQASGIGLEALGYRV